jgi:hypothetical protein
MAVLNEPARMSGVANSIRIPILNSKSARYASFCATAGIPEEGSMRRAVVYPLAILFILGMVFGSCTTVEDSVALAMLESTEKVDAVEFPELIMTDYIGIEREIKILSVRGRMVTVSPFPYWAQDPLEISINEIRSLRVKRKSNPGITLTLVFMEIGYITAGGAFGVLADTRGEYGLAFLGGLGGALLGLGSAVFSDIGETGQQMYPEYYLDGKSESEKLRTILQIMGVF